MELPAAFRAAPLYAIYDTQASAAISCADTISAWLRAGIRVIQYRHKGAWERGNFDDCRAEAQLAKQAGALFLTNDRADVALFAGAEGVHVGQDDLAPSAVRRLLPLPAIVGHSTHSLQQIRAALAMPVDYIAVGPVYSTASKENPDPVVGLELVRQARRATTLPLVAIGGIDQKNLAGVLQAGADAVAMISGLVAGCSTAAEVERRARELLHAALTAKASPPEPV
jgi:thiamine-phosphate pyrophosphorylase